MGIKIVYHGQEEKVEGKKVEDYENIIYVEDAAATSCSCRCICPSAKAQSLGSYIGKQNQYI